MLAPNLGAPDGVRHRPDGKVEQVRVVPLELGVARQTPHEDRIQLLIMWFREKIYTLQNQVRGIHFYQHQSHASQWMILAWFAEQEEGEREKRIV